MNFTELEYNYTQMFRRLVLANADNDHFSVRFTDSQTTVDGVPVRKLFVNNLAQRSTYKDLQKCFSTYGDIESCYLRRNNNKKSNYAFVTFYKVEDANLALENGLSKKIRLHNRDLKVLPADSWHQPDNVEKKLHIMGNIHSENSEDSAPQLSCIALEKIVPFLTFKDRLIMERVCSQWRNGLLEGKWRDIKRLSLTSKLWDGINIPSLQTASLRQILLRCGLVVRELDLSYQLHSLSLSTVSVIANLCPTVEVLDLSGVTISSSSLDVLALKCKNLIKLTLGITMSPCDTELKNVMKETNLKYLALKRTSITGKCLAELKPETMSTLIVDKCEELKDMYLAKILARLKLNHLEIHFCPHVKHLTLEAISGCTSLELLKLEGVFTTSSYVQNWNVLLINLVELKFLTVTCTSAITYHFFENMANSCKKLTSLTIIGCAQVTRETIAPIDTRNALTCLKTLILNGLEINDDSLLNLYGLKHFECRKCDNVTSEGIKKVITNSPDLQILDVSGCKGIDKEILTHANTEHKRLAGIDGRPKLKVYVGATNIIKNENPPHVYPWLRVIYADLSDLGTYKNLDDIEALLTPVEFDEEENEHE